MGCCACVQSKKVAPASPPPAQPSQEPSGHAQHPPLQLAPPYMHPEAAPSGRHGAVMAPDNPTGGSGGRGGGSPVWGGYGTAYPAADVLPGHLPSSDSPTPSSAAAAPQRHAELPQCRPAANANSTPPHVASAPVDHGGAAEDDDTSSGDYEMPEEQCQAATAGDDDDLVVAPKPSGGFQMPGMDDRDDYPRRPQQQAAPPSSRLPSKPGGFDDDEVSSSTSEDDDKGDEKSVGRARAAAVLKQIRRRNGGKKASSRTGGRGGRKVSTPGKAFDSDEYEAPEESSMSAEGAAPSARLVF